MILYYLQAAALFEQVIAVDPTYKQALFGFGLCKMKLEDYPEAINYLSKTIELEKSYKEYTPWSALAHAFWSNGQKQDAIDLLQKLIQMYPNIKFKTELASYLIQLDMKNEASNLLHEVLDAHKNSPGYVKRANSDWVKEAKRLLKIIEFRVRS